MWFQGLRGRERGSLHNPPIPPDHPRAASLKTREKLIKAFEGKIVATSGLLAHGRGEAFDYLLGEESRPFSLEAEKAAVAMLLLAERSVISVNGNAAALCAEGLVELARLVGAALEVNLFYWSEERVRAVERRLREAGAGDVLGVGVGESSAVIPHLSSRRRKVDPRGIFAADVVMVPLEDGDRTEALVGMGKTVIAIDLNPLSRTAQKATITIVDNIDRAIPNMICFAREMGGLSRSLLAEEVGSFGNRRVLSDAFGYLRDRLTNLSTEGRHLETKAANRAR